MSNSSLAIHSTRGGRRSTRVNQAIRLAIGGVDSFRGPYKEDVSTVTVSCHGCMYESKYEVSPNAFVTLEMHGNGQDSSPISTRGRVRWIQRPAERGTLFQTAIELEAPGNIWGIDSPPSDWLPFCVPHNPVAVEPKLKTNEVLRPKAASATTKEASATTKEAPSKTVSTRVAELVSPQASATRPVSQLIGGFQQQMEKMLSEAAEAVLQERAASLLNDMRAGLREEAKRVMAETGSRQAGSWIDESLKRMKQIGEESARTRHAQWTKKIEADLQQTLARMDMRCRELEEASERMVTKAQDQLQGFLEASRKDAVDRIIVRLKEQSGPVIDHARKTAADLTKREQELEKICQQHVAKSAASVEESCARFDKQFEMILRERLDSFREELDRAAQASARSVLTSVRASSQQQEAEAQARLHGALEPVTEGALANLKEKAADISRQFGAELAHYSRSHLEFVSGAISELAKGIGKLSNS